MKKLMCRSTKTYDEFLGRDCIVQTNNPRIRPGDIVSVFTDGDKIADVIARDTYTPEGPIKNTCRRCALNGIGCPVIIVPASPAGCTDIVYSCGRNNIWFDSIDAVLEGL